MKTLRNPLNDEQAVKNLKQAPKTETDVESKSQNHEEN